MFFQTQEEENKTWETIYYNYVIHIALSIAFIWNSILKYFRGNIVWYTGVSKTNK